jgi:hypothetical protein
MPLRVQIELPQPALDFEDPIGRWFTRGERLDDKTHTEGLQTHPWYKVLWLTGVDYFSTLGYQPGIALLAAGAIAPLATVILVAVTLLGALPVYAQVARRSYAGQGSIAMLENLLPGWRGKLLVLILLGFAATDFVITMTLSAADAAKHAIENPLLHPLLGEHQILVTLALLTALAAVFMKGFKEAIGVSAIAAIPYLLLNLAVLGRGTWEILTHPSLLGEWRQALNAQGDWTMLMAGALLVFPKLALGLSGFETGVSVMPLIDGGEEPEEEHPRRRRIPLGRIAATRKLLASAALIMSVMLVLSSFVTTLLIHPVEYKEGGPASGRAIAFLAHKHLGTAFGTIYDMSTILILGLAGASAMAGLLHLIPRYLPRFGMAPMWAVLARPLVLVLYGICVVVTLVFKADVEAQGGAYATGVLVLILSAAFAATLALWKEKSRLPALYSGFVTLVFLYTLVDNCIERPDGLIIGGCFILLTLTVSGISRWRRSTEFRVSHAYFADAESARIAPDLRGKKVHMVPVKSSDAATRGRKKAEVRRYYKATGPIAFVTVHLADNRSDFKAPLEISIERDGEDYVVEVFGAIAIANTLAYLSELIDPISIFVGLTRQNLMQQAFRYLLFGEGETGLMVYTILLRYWEWTPEEDIRPLIFLMSD